MGFSGERTAISGYWGLKELHHENVRRDPSRLGRGGAGGNIGYRPLPGEPKELRLEVVRTNRVSASFMFFFREFPSWQCESWRLRSWRHVG